MVDSDIGRYTWWEDALCGRPFLTFPPTLLLQSKSMATSYSMQALAMQQAMASMTPDQIAALSMLK